MCTIYQGNGLTTRRVGHSRSSWAIGRNISENAGMPEMVMVCAILTHAKTVQTTPSRRADPGVQLLIVGASVDELSKFGLLVNTHAMITRMKQDPVFLRDVLSQAVGLNYASQIAGGTDFVGGQNSDIIGYAATCLYKVRSIGLFIQQYCSVVNSTYRKTLTCDLEYQMKYNIITAVSFILRY